MKKLLLCCGLLLLFGNLKAQSDGTNYNRTDIISQSPTASSLERQRSASINQSTGSPSLSIPIFTVTGNELSLPISLNYGYGGFKPAVPIGWAGMGWSLQAGGVITRTVHGAVDHTFLTGRNYDDIDMDTVIYSVNVPSQTFLESSATVLYDTEPDVYNFNFAGYSGSFIYYKGGFICMPEQKFKITGDGASAFTITTDNGTKYTFGAIETTSAKGSPNADYTVPTHSSAWYLSKIENAAGTDKITLSYISEGKVGSEGILTQSYKKNITFGYASDYELLAARVTLPTYSTSLRLSSITSEKYNVDFGAQTADREDIYQYDGGHSKALKQITVTDHLGSRTLKKFVFNMEYFNTGGSDYSVKYLKLKSLDEVPSLPLLDDPDPDTTLKKKTWTFDYESEELGFPSKAMAWVDHYGFYTGKGNFSSNIIPNTIYALGPDREPELGGSSYGALKKVTYPTGGYSTYLYEQNYRNDGQNYVSYDQNVQETASGPAVYPSTVVTSAGSVFYIGATQNVTVHLERNPVNLAYDGIIKNGEMDYQLFHSTEEGLPLIHGLVSEDYIGLDSENGGKDFIVSLTPGYYVFWAQADDNENYINGKVYYKEITNIPIEGKAMGGIRVKTTKDYPITGEVSETTYRYTDSLGFSTGISNYGDTYPISSFKEIHVPPTGPPVDKDFIIYNSAISLREGAGVPHYYTTVYEDKKLGDAKFTTKTSFVDFSDYGLSTVPAQIINYKNVGNTKVPINKIENTYEFVIGNYVRSIRAVQVMQMIGGGFGYSGPNKSYDYGTPLYIPGWFKNLGSRTITYEGADSLITTTFNSYNTITHNLTMSKTYSSDGSEIISKFKYPEDYSTTLNSSFISANVLAPAWETQVWRKKSTDSILVDLRATSFSNTQFVPLKAYAINGAGINALDSESKISGKYSTLLSDSRLEERITFAYDSAARIISQQPTNGVPTSYKWGYAANTALAQTLGQKNYPIAEIVNGLPSEIYFQNFEEASGATSGAAHTGDKFLAGDYTVNWTVPNSKSYRLSYWYLDSGTWKFHEQVYTGSTTLELGSAIDDVVICPIDAQVRTFTYQLGVGYSSITDAKGNTTFFEYDMLNRLKAVKDQHGDIIKSNSYNYKY